MTLAVPNVLRAEAPVRLGATPTAALVWLADGMGLLKDGFRPIEVHRYTSGTKTAKDVVAGKLDLATSSEFAFVSMGFERPDLRILASLSRSRTVGVFGRADRGVTSYADLDGKTIGFVPGSFGHFLMHQVLLRSGAEPGQLLEMRPKEMVAAIEAGSIEAGVIWEPYFRQVSKALGDNFVALPGEGANEYQFILHGTADWISTNQNAANDLVAKLVEASSFAAADPAKAKKLIGKRLHLDMETMDYLWPKHTLKVTLSQSLLRLMEDEAWFWIDLGFFSGEVPDYLNMIAPEALRSADPNGISIIGLS